MFPEAWFREISICAVFCAGEGGFVSVVTKVGKTRPNQGTIVLGNMVGAASRARPSEENMPFLEYLASLEIARHLILTPVLHVARVSAIT